MKKKEHVAASVIVHDIAGMTPNGRKAICGWLRKIALNIDKYPDQFSKTFRARYLYTANAAHHGRDETR